MLFIKEIMKKTRYFTNLEIGILLCSITLIVVPFFIFDKTNYYNMIVSLIGTVSLLFCAKGNPIGQMLMIIFATLYAYIALTGRYYSEIITYLFMTMPIAVISLISWLKNPAKKGKMEVKVNVLSKKELLFTLFLATVLTIVFFFILRALNTANLVVSTISIFTSAIAGYLTIRRCEYFALGYVLNDFVLIALWGFATISSIEYLSVLMCFFVFLLNDSYTFINWRRMKKRQAEQE